MANTTNYSGLLRPVLAEFLGTTLLTLVVGVLVAGIGYQYIFTSFFVGLTLTVAIFLFGWVSVAHFNPAVTIAQAIFRKVEIPEAVAHIIGQVIGAFAGLKVASILLAGAPMPTLPDMTTASAVAEFLGALIVSAAVMVVVQKRVSEQSGPMVIGMALTVAAAVTGAGVFNPAIALAFGSIAFVYLGMPILGAIVGAALMVLFDETAQK